MNSMQKLNIKLGYLKHKRYLAASDYHRDATPEKKEELVRLTKACNDISLITQGELAYE